MFGESGIITGVMGMNKGMHSFLMQTQQRKFSYCLPSRDQSSVTFGDDVPVSPQSLLVQLMNIPSKNYFVSLVGIRFKPTDEKLPINQHTALVDTGSTHTQLEAHAYMEVMRAMNAHFHNFKQVKLNDFLCYESPTGKWGGGGKKG